eukprot:TRINITY_DN45145_c0_g1_i1.p1 TRINITY_DN45145_c0_g1~~TRINITY_DN45145_c0_g1_i1.p1  ORF type:complete len:329 (+),score=16.73 TRINITY_DN45145_c0_g1_i1:194-1180(+)
MRLGACSWRPLLGVLHTASASETLGQQPGQDERAPARPPAECWGEVFNEELCCDTHRYGTEGNRACWGDLKAVYNFQKCCVAGRAVAKKIKDYLHKFAEGDRRRLEPEAVESLRRAFQLAPSWHSVQSDVLLLRAISKQLPFGDHTCSTSRPLFRLMQRVDIWSGARKQVPGLLCLVYTAGHLHRVHTQWLTWGHACDRFVAVSDRPWPSGGKWAVRDHSAKPPFEVLQLKPHGVAVGGFDKLWHRVRTVWLEVARGVPAVKQWRRQEGYWRTNMTIDRRRLHAPLHGWDWAFLCGDDTHVVVENLRKELLRQQGGDESFAAKHNAAN